MIISRTPFRISFFGGGTDFPAWYLNNNGKVISATINKYCYITSRILPPFFKYNYRLRYYKTEEVKKISQIKHPTIREILKYKEFNKKLELSHTADLPALSGLGSSSSFTVGLINSINALTGKMESKKTVANEACFIEQKKCNEFVGSQDQYAASFGGFNIINFSRNNVEVKLVPNSYQNIKLLENSIILIFTGFQRKANILEKEKIKNIEKKSNYYKLIYELSEEAEKKLFTSKNIVNDFSNLINEYWEIKKKLSKDVSNQKIDSMINFFKKNGASSCKLLGAGNGGFIMCLVNEKNKIKFLKKINKMLVVPISFEYSGSQIIYYSSNEKNYA